jgi:hypothetical protein
LIKQYLKFLSYLFLVILLIIPKSFAKDGFGKVKFTSQSYQHFLSYLRGDGNPTASGVMMTSGIPTGFAINQKGNRTFYYYCPKKYGDNCMPGGKIRAQNDCSKISKKSGDGRCFVFAKGRVIVWDSANIKIPKKVTVEQVREIFKENGWY